MPIPTTDPATRVVELASELTAIPEDAVTYRTNADGCWACGDGDRLCEDHKNDVAIADAYRQTVYQLQAEAEWAARDAAALEALAEVLRTTSVCAGAGELMSRLAPVLIGAGRQISPTT